MQAIEYFVATKMMFVNNIHEMRNCDMIFGKKKAGCKNSHTV